MVYRQFGNTGIKVSALGFGAMRLPTRLVGGRRQVNEERALRVIRRAFELGVNYIDTAYVYHEGVSEVIVGRAVRQWPGRVYVATKLPTWHVSSRGDFRRFLEEELRRLDLPAIDFYHLHSLNETLFRDKIRRFKVIPEAVKAREEGLVRHLAFSFHDRPALMKQIIDEGVFAAVLCQYNLLNRDNEPAIADAAARGLGVAVMGPVAGGRLSASEVLSRGLGGQVRTTPELALRFVLANPLVSTAVSGMSTMRMVAENARAAGRSAPLTREQLASLEKFIAERRTRREIPCNGCGYCLPCPREVAISEIFQLANLATVFGLTAHARDRYARFGLEGRQRRARADACNACGRCAEKCPQKINIADELKKTHRLLG